MCVSYIVCDTYVEVCVCMRDVYMKRYMSVWDVCGYVYGRVYGCVCVWGVSVYIERMCIWRGICKGVCVFNESLNQ